MKGQYLVFVIAFTLVMLLIDLYAFRGVQILTRSLSGNNLRHFVFVCFWAATAVILSWIFFVMANSGQMRNPKFFSTYVMPLIGLIILSVIPKLVFILFLAADDLAKLFFFLVSKSGSGSKTIISVGEVISRRSFLTHAGAAIAVVPFISVAYGILKGKYNFRVLKEEIPFGNLPSSFDGLRIVQISDIHLGSFGDDFEQVKKGIGMVNELEPDVIFFTGDLVNNFAEETNGWQDILSGLEAKKGKFSILGNHDYGDYVPWKSKEEKQENLNKIIEFHKKTGFRILLNESVKLQNGNDEISVIGVENWGRPPFPRHGNLKKAMSENGNSPFRILLSHDPSHWEEEIIHKTDIDLTFSGHTHGMQFGVEVGSVKWSPVQLKYPRWGGLYSVGKQYLYVNRGFGFIAFPGRVGMPPEITLVVLRKKPA